MHGLRRALVPALAVILAGCARPGQAPVAPQAAPASAAVKGTDGVTPVGKAAAEKAPASRQEDDAAAPQAPGWLGVELALRLPEHPGVLVRAVVPGSPAERAGIQTGDVVLSIDGESVARPSEVVALIAGRRSGERVGVVLTRAEQQRLVAVTLEGLPNEEGLMKRRYVDGAAPALAELSVIQGSVAPSLRELRGNVVVIEFWATWCVPCRITAPLLSGWHDRYGAEGLKVLGVTAEPVSVAADAARHQSMTYPLFSDGTGATTRAYRAFALPTLFVVDRQGVVRDVMVGFSSERLREIEALIQRLLATG